MTAMSAETNRLVVENYDFSRFESIIDVGHLTHVGDQLMRADAIPARPPTRAMRAPIATDEVDVQRRKWFLGPHADWGSAGRRGSSLAASR